MASAACMPPEMLLGFLYGYHPSFGAAIFGACLFGLLSVASLWPTIKSRAWFMLLVTITAALEAVGYASRAVMSANTPCQALSAIYVSSNFFLVVTPVLVAIVEYSSCGRLLMLSKAQRVLGMRTRHMVWVFSCCDVFTLFVQMSGGGMMAMQGLQKIGTQLMLAGLVIQLGFYFFFGVVVTYAWVHRDEFGLQGIRGVRRIFICITGSMLLLAMRNIYRVVEFAEFTTVLSGGTNTAKEGVFYGLDLVPVSLAILLLVVLHPGVLLQCISTCMGTAAHVVKADATVSIVEPTGDKGKTQLCSTSSKSALGKEPASLPLPAADS